MLKLLYWVIYTLILQNVCCILRYISASENKLPDASVLSCKPFITLICCIAFRFGSEASCLLISIAISLYHSLKYT